MLHLANSQEIDDKIASGDGRVAKLLKAKKSTAEAVDELYLAAYSRYPTTTERKKHVAYVVGQSSEARALEDIVWALLNSREFLFNH